jgi:hypothetical protein
MTDSETDALKPYWRRTSNARSREEVPISVNKQLPEGAKPEQCGFLSQLTKPPRTWRSAANCGLARDLIATAASVATSGSAMATFVPINAVTATPAGRREAATTHQQNTPRTLASAIQERVCDPAMGKLSVRMPQRGLMSQGRSGRELYSWKGGTRWELVKAAWLR